MIDLRNINVTIKDKEALMLITPDQLKQYLEDKDFTVYSDLDEGNGTIYEKYSEKHHIPIRVVHLHDHNDETYSLNMASNMMNLEKVMEQTQLQIFLDITDNELIMFSERRQKELEGEVDRVMQSLDQDNDS